MNNTNKNLNPNSFQRTMKVIKSSFTTQFKSSTILVAVVLAVLALLGPIIQLSIRDLETQQTDKINLFLTTDIGKEMMKRIPDFKLHNDADINALINQIPQFEKYVPGINKIIPQLENMKISRMSFAILGQVFSTSILYSLGRGIFTALRDKNSIDKNRVMYMNYGKGKLLFFKLLSETMFFLFIVITADVLGIILVKYVGKGTIDLNLIKQLIVQLIGIAVFYFFIQVGVRFITSRIDSKTTMGIVLAIWLLSTAFLYVVLSIVLGVKPDSVQVISDNKYAFTFTPIANIVVLPLVLYGYLPMWTIIPFIVYLTIAIGLVWRILTPSVKDYLCS
ncbi:hypothetical protein MYMA111404_03895 [Mycoplasma marinum]|uniref:Uncharacterized protein n=1 Tax=Mycoplasma marinum TaxID=1937190 RepID=A0A4V2NHY3_9MOLU|nr:hypothetical protein [Mycoplasma marinum]TCG10658.1 hypothetical protein C4B24_04305 [Mycoplasma marinum]